MTQHSRCRLLASFLPRNAGIQQSWHSKITPTCGGQGIELDSVRVTPQPSRRQTNSTSPHMSRTHSGFTLVRSPRAMIARKTHSFRVHRILHNPNCFTLPRQAVCSFRWFAGPFCFLSRHKLTMWFHQHDQLLVIFNVPHKGLTLGATVFLPHAL